MDNSSLPGVRNSCVVCVVLHFCKRVRRFRILFALCLAPWSRHLSVAIATLGPGADEGGPQAAREALPANAEGAGPEFIDLVLQVRAGPGRGRANVRLGADPPRTRRSRATSWPRSWTRRRVRPSRTPPSTASTPRSMRPVWCPIRAGVMSRLNAWVAGTRRSFWRTWPRSGAAPRAC
jgi:hypothetical protein